MLVGPAKICNICCIEEAFLNCSQCDLCFCTLCDQEHHTGDQTDHSRTTIVIESQSLENSLTEDYEIVPHLSRETSSAVDALDIIGDSVEISNTVQHDASSIEPKCSAETLEESQQQRFQGQGDHSSSSSSDLEYKSLSGTSEEEEELVSLPPINRQWECDRCSFLNPESCITCTVCERNRHNISDILDREDIDEEERNAVLQSHRITLLTKINACKNLPMDMQFCVPVVNLSELEGVRASKFDHFIVYEFWETVDAICSQIKTRGELDPEFSHRYIKREVLNKIKDPKITSKEQIITGVLKEKESIISEILSLGGGNLFTKEGIENALSVCESLSIGEVLDKLNQRTYDTIIANNYSPSVSSVEAILLDSSIDMDAKIRIAQVEFSLSYDKVINYLDLTTDPDILDRGVSIDSLISVVRDCHSSMAAKSFLCQDCPTCYLPCTMNEMHGFMNCECKMCWTCFQTWLTECIKSQSPNRWYCPLCESKNYLEHHITDLRLIIQNRPELEELKELFDNKVTTWTMQKDPYFRWCSHKCGNGFIADGFFEKVQCQLCQKYTCRKCKKMWEPEHNDMTCEEFEAWKISNDPELSRVLEEIGIDCPQCKARFEFARGGCLHFTCRLCSFEFCCGCRQAFKRGQECQDGKNCQSRGLHAHHPRNCLFYLRDFSVDDLKSLLQESEVEIQRANSGNIECLVNETSESVSGYVDIVCKKPVLEHGLCEMHFKEFLVAEINRNVIDPARLFSDRQLVRIAELAELQDIPQPNENATADDGFTEIILNFVKEKIPLKKLK